MSEQNINNVNEDAEIDLVALVKRLWRKRRFVIYVTLIFMGLGLFVALFSSKEYTASTTFVPQSDNGGMSSSMGALASLAGISLDQLNSSGTLSPAIYPQLLSNVEFMKELMYTPIKFEEWPEKITLFDYFTDPQYSKPSIPGLVIKYTLGLPGVIIQAVRGEEEDTVAAVSESGIPQYSKKEYDCCKRLKEIVSIDYNDKDGYVELSVSMPEPLAAAEVASAVFALLEKYITDYKLAQVKATLDFVNDRYDEAKADFEAKQMAYAKFRDANRVLTTATAQITDDRMQREYNLSNSIYSQLASQKTQIELQVKENTPVLSVVEPVVVPFEKSKPKRAVIMVAFTFLGAFFGCAFVFGLDFLKKNGSSWPRGWKTEEEENGMRDVKEEEVA
ncbi:MAG TPA: lipopolysaccharide biosynthesis protein [Candidatus Coprenecus stercoravium]|uniref:Lipopolysaccharide biosynthesis protein n=1 Tax=Candidatus Coprenecus stercoravium TaxID=2840735 RepID=A0A9D2GQN0_9BACT|nr:lipopolysaccharide biosynthesis protein [Candidatus Coprenecus stercoravium]